MFKTTSQQRITETQIHTFGFCLSCLPVWTIIMHVLLPKTSKMCQYHFFSAVFRSSFVLWVWQVTLSDEARNFFGQVHLRSNHYDRVSTLYSWPFTRIIWNNHAWVLPQRHTSGGAFSARERFGTFVWGESRTSNVSNFRLHVFISQVATAFKWVEVWKCCGLCWST